MKLGFLSHHFFLCLHGSLEELEERHLTREQAPTAHFKVIGKSCASYPCFLALRAQLIPKQLLQKQRNKKIWREKKHLQRIEWNVSKWESLSISLPSTSQSSSSRLSEIERDRKILNERRGRNTWESYKGVINESSELHHRKSSRCSSHG